MINEQAIVQNSSLSRKILTFSALVILTAFLPTVIHSQFITGPLVNMALILAVFLLGPFEAVFLGLMPSVLALASGLLPLPLAPMVPFIMISNAILIGVYYYLGKKKFLISIAVASFLKFLFLFGIFAFLSNFLLNGKVVPALALMMGWPQFVSAVLGGTLAHLALAFINKRA
jgi:hypothetical protein